MKVTIWADKDGFKHRSLLRDSDPDTAAEGGLRLDPPNIRDIDWEGVQRDLHNALVDHELLTWQDIQRKPGLRNILISCLKRRVIALYRTIPEVDNE